MQRNTRALALALAILALLWWPGLAWSQTVSLLPNGMQQFVDANGAPYAGGVVYLYVPGTTTPKNSWQDPNATTLNSNPIVLDSAGRAAIWGLGEYRQVLQDSLGNTIWDRLTYAPAPASASGNPYWGGNGGGTANAQTVSISGASSLQSLVGITIGYVPIQNNSGAATLNVNSYGAVAINKLTPNGLLALSGGELGGPVQLFYDGSEFDLITDYSSKVPIGTIQIATNDSTNADPGFLLADGACVSEATYANLYAVIGSTYSTQDSCSGSNFGLPDLRGRMPAGLDNMGGTAANRITSAVSGVTGTTLGAAGASQGYATGIRQTYLQNFSISVSTNIPSGNGIWYGSSLGGTSSGAQSGSAVAGAFLSSLTLSSSSGGSGTAFPTLSPTQIVDYEIKY